MTIRSGRFRLQAQASIIYEAGGKYRSDVPDVQLR